MGQEVISSQSIRSHSGHRPQESRAQDVGFQPPERKVGTISLSHTACRRSATSGRRGTCPTHNGRVQSPENIAGGFGDTSDKQYTGGEESSQAQSRSAPQGFNACNGNAVFDGLPSAPEKVQLVTNISDPIHRPSQQRRLCQSIKSVFRSFLCCHQ